MKIEEITAALDLAQAARQFLAAKEHEKQKKQAYIRARREWIWANGAQKMKWVEVMNDAGFRLATNRLYSDYEVARKQRYKAMRRMMTRYKKLTTLENTGMSVD
ncbi:hypothetical protein [Marinobacterium stanieri]|uniref:hypothetical protein n=1 Tax=Marinobacterium stanieri TaxID=49186 RepID=UPI000255A5FC|nr:hypothetical protein [Marinobacterium stanieri]